MKHYLFGGVDLDTFLTHGDAGAAVIEDFTQGQDQVEVHGSGLTSLADLKAHTTDFGSYSVITLDAETSIWMIGLTSAQFTTTDFFIVS